MVPLSLRSALEEWPGKLALILMLPLAFVCTGCGNSCFNFVSNPGGVVGGGTFSSSCTATTLQGAVQAVAEVAPLCETCSQSNQVQSVIVSLRGVELHPRANASEEPADWQALFPALEIQPRQFELTKAGGTGPVATSLGDAVAIPVGTYDRIRMRFVMNLGSAVNSPAAENACGEAGLNCVVMGDGHILPLALDGGVLELPIFSERSADGALIVLPESENQLLITLTPVWSLAPSAGGGARLLPALRGSARMLSAN